MKKKRKYGFSFRRAAHITFDEEGYIVEVKNFGTVMWSNSAIDKELIGLHINELMPILEDNSPDPTWYNDFCNNVYKPMQKIILKNQKKKQRNKK